MQCNYNSFIQITNFHGLFRNALRCRKTGACRILVLLRYTRSSYKLHWIEYFDKPKKKCRPTVCPNLPEFCVNLHKFCMNWPKYLPNFAQIITMAFFFWGGGGGRHNAPCLIGLWFRVLFWGWFSQVWDVVHLPMDVPPPPPPNPRLTLSFI